MDFQTAMKFWRNIDISNLQRQFDEQAAEIAKRQDQSDVSLKRLLELSKEFKRTNTEDVRRKVSALLRAFQCEVDFLTKRSSVAETIFLTLYKKVIEIPDPLPLLEQAFNLQQRVLSDNDLSLENMKLRETLEEYNLEFAHVKNQASTISKLKSQIKELELSIDQQATSKASKMEAKLINSYAEKEKDFLSVLSVKEKEGKEDQLRLSTLQSALDSTKSELFELKNKQEDITSAKSAEIEILATDLERANQHVLDMERQLNAFKNVPDKGFHSSSLNDKLTQDSNGAELKLIAKEEEVLCLLQDIAHLQDSMKQLNESCNNQISLLKQELSEKEKCLSVLEDQLNDQKDYCEIKKELLIVKSVEFGSFQEHFDDSCVVHETNKSVEELLLQKSRALVNENTFLKSELSELKDQFKTVENQYKLSLKSIQDQKALIRKLESDLTRVKPYVSQHSEELDSSEIIAEVVHKIHSEKSVSPNMSESIMNIVTSQRERFQRKNAELEAENQQHKMTIIAMQNEAELLKSDNVNLYAKIRFLQSYEANKTSANEPDVTVKSYSSQYEAKLDPFSAFNVKERQRKYMQLNGPDKATLLLGKFILSSKIARMIALCYAILLHIVIILVLAQLVSSSGSQTVDLYAECAKQFTEHMHIFHKGNNEIMKVMQDGGGDQTG